MNPKPNSTKKTVLSIVAILVAGAAIFFLAPSMIAIVSLVQVLTGSSDTYTYRYKLTIEAEVDGITYSASSVTEVYQSLDGMKNRHYSVKGEALYLDLGPGRRPLIALMNAAPRNDGRYAPCQWGDGGPSCPAELYGVPEPEWNYETRKFDGFEVLARQRGPREISLDRLPDFVTFTDINDPKTVLTVDPTNPGKALAGDFRWKRMTIELTDEAVTVGLKTHLPWINDYYDSNLAGQKAGEDEPDYGLASRMATVSFQQGFSQPR